MLAFLGRICRLADFFGVPENHGRIFNHGRHGNAFGGTEVVIEKNPFGLSNLLFIPLPTNANGLSTFSMRKPH